MRTTGLLAIVVLGSAAFSAGAQPSQRYNLSQQISVDRLGLSVRYPSGWSASQDANTAWIVNAPLERAVGPALDKMAQIHVVTETRLSHAEAIERLREIASAYTGPLTYITIGGWPALQVRAVTDKEQPGNDQEQHPPEKIINIVTAIAAGNLIIRAQGRMPLATSRSVEDQVRAIEAGIVFRTLGDPAATSREMRSLRARPRLPVSPAPPSRVKPAARRQDVLATPLARGPAGFAIRAGFASPSGAPSTLVPASGPVLEPGLAQVVIGGGVASEPEIAVSTNGQNIVIGQGFTYTISTDGGQTFSASKTFPNSDGGDASIAFGRSGNFYEGTINQRSSAINILTTGATTFTAGTNAYNCPTSGPNQCGFARGNPPVPFPDQEHIAADRFNAGTGTGDQVYSAFRNGNGFYGIACSTDSAQNFGAPIYTAGDFPRITVGQDGFVYVVFQDGNDVSISRYTSCQAGIALQAGYPHKVVIGTSPTYVNCPMPGLDRCNGGANRLHSHMVAVDDTNPNHIFVTYAQSTSATNENVIVRDSTDAGVTWPNTRVVTVSAAINARRFMPWVCSLGGVAQASWYDRRASTSTSNDLTDYYAGNAFVDAAGNLVPGTEVQINAPGSADAQCNAGQPTGSNRSWRGGSRAINDSSTCSAQPQLAGQCKHTPSTATDSNQACNLSGPNTCPTGPPAETCQLASGVPKYGDYNGNACSAGRLYSIWASATPPPTKPVSGNIDLYFASSILCCAPQIQVPGPVVFPDTCVGTSSIQTANVCNDGKADLSIDPITSSDPQFSVSSPSSGYPLKLVPGACFPFQVKFAPSSPGPKSATLTVPSNDPVTPSAKIAVSGTAGQPTIATAIANTGDFGTVCPGSFKDLELTLHNNGSCPLIVSGIGSSSAEFKTASVLSFPLTIAPGGSIDVPIRFEPSSAGAKIGNISINSNDPAHSLAQVAVRGLGGQPVINTIIADTGDFGTLCRGLFRDLPLTIQNSGTCPLKVTGIVSSSPEFETAQVLSYPLTIAPGTALEVPIRFRPISSGAKSATITISSDDPATPTKVVNVKAFTPPEYICHPPTFAVAGINVGPTFGPSRTGDFSMTGYGRFLAPFGVRKTYGVQAQGEYLYYHEGRQEGQFDAGLLARIRWAQFGAFGDFKYAQLDAVRNGSGLGQAAFTLDFLFLKKARFGIFGTKGFRDYGVVQRAVTLQTTGAGLQVEHSLETYLKIVDQFGGSGQVQLPHRTYLEGSLAYLKRYAIGLDDRPGAMVRIVHQFKPEIGFTLEGDFNETFVGRHDSGRVVFGIQFGHWPRPRDLTDRRNPLGTEVPRVHFEVLQRQR